MATWKSVAGHMGPRTSCWTARYEVLPHIPEYCPMPISSADNCWNHFSPFIVYTIIRHHHHHHHQIIQMFLLSNLVWPIVWKRLDTTGSTLANWTLSKQMMMMNMKLIKCSLMPSILSEVSERWNYLSRARPQHPCRSIYRVLIWNDVENLLWIHSWTVSNNQALI